LLILIGGQADGAQNGNAVGENPKELGVSLIPIYRAAAPRRAILGEEEASFRQKERNYRHRRLARSRASMAMARRRSALSRVNHLLSFYFAERRTPSSSNFQEQNSQLSAKKIEITEAQSRKVASHCRQLTYQETPAGS